MHKHKDFILSPITNILADAVSASAGIGSGIETYPLCDYIMQSTFLKMTGFQEQKMKCICWEMATNDYDYRYDFTQKKLGECSNYTDKKNIYSDLIKQIENLGTPFSNNLISNKTQLLANTFSDITTVFTNTNLALWAEYDFLIFKDILNHLKSTHFANDKGSLFSDQTLKDIYENHLYKLRNRIAHNTQSYQQNLPTLKSLAKDEHKYENLFVYFFILNLIDKIFIALFEKYLIAIKENAN